ncbi:MAG TPA: hypothetical protein PKL98_00295 [Candidatus Pacearchaeota archaeon]|nr:hypothetical protein [Candidatus Pacearchaeota archaeon]HPM08359.1 hypothetical protein [Candidatus Pacearchaeota archaeon]
MEFFLIIFYLALIIGLVALYIWICNCLRRMGENSGLDYNWISYIPGLQTVQIARIAGLGWAVGWILLLVESALYVLSKTLSYNIVCLIIITVISTAISAVLWCMVSYKFREGEWGYGLIMIIPIINLFMYGEFAKNSDRYAELNNIQKSQA